MTDVSILKIIPVIQTAISPVVLISGVGLFLLTLTNRLGRAIDRARSLATQKEKIQEPTKKQLETLLQRARLLRLAIILAALSALLAALMVIFLFLGVLLNIELGGVVGIAFILGMFSLIGSIVFFILDINKALVALKMEIREH